ncbi:hypothetical protein KIH27_05030 [Mycobacterium sp. M1]|uniref:Transport accessory protein MmpS3 n=1 Tax=Mycolicibacter acidiphilus TaxID=2835306 RepID=A0ABS5RF99_9MYCO|nr:MmpS family transport accessory protein [Mycolicibacter acidiphilus]MBS9532952.1 hypothetical protein [Mycolicibacter acidiphilus]
MSGPNPPEPGPGSEDPDSGQPSAEGISDDLAIADGGSVADLVVDEAPEAPAPARPSDTAYSQAYSAPESEQFMTGPYVPMDPRLYDYDSYDAPAETDSHPHAPRWPWVVGVTVIIAAIALVVSVALLFARTETQEIATPATSTSTPLLPPVQDEITTTRTTTSTTTPPPPPTSEEPPPPPPTSEEPPPPPPVAEAPAPEPTTTTAEVTTTTTATQARPLQVTYTVTGTKAPFDQITITYVDASGQRRTQRNAYIPWSLTLTPISQSEVGSVEATSMLRLSKLNCSITSSDGRVLSSNSNDAPQTSC